MIRIWKQAFKEGLPGSLPVVIPVVIYHGIAKWKVEERFLSVFKCPEGLRDYLPDFSYALCDISRYSDEEIRVL